MITGKLKADAGSIYMSSLQGESLLLTSSNTRMLSPEDWLTVKTQLLVLWWVLDGSEVPACWEPLLCRDRAENSWFLDGDTLLCGRLDSSLAHAQNSNSCRIHSEPFRFSTASMLVVGLKTCPCNHSGNPGHRFKEMVEGNLFIQSKCHCFGNSQDRWILVFWGTVGLSTGSNIGLSILVIIYWKPTEETEEKETFLLGTKKYCCQWEWPVSKTPLWRKTLLGWETRRP